MDDASQFLGADLGEGVAANGRSWWKIAPCDDERHRRMLDNQFVVGEVEFDRARLCVQRADVANASPAGIDGEIECLCTDSVTASI